METEKEVKIAKAFILRAKNGDVGLEELDSDKYQLFVGQTSVVLTKMELDALFDLRCKL